jgi:hypothetical protein
LAPALVPDASPTSSMSQDLSKVSKEFLVLYQLRNIHISFSGEVNHKLDGLGKNLFPFLVERGGGEDPTFLKLKLRAMDMAVDRQLSITGALRVVQTSEGVAK